MNTIVLLIAVLALSVSCKSLTETEYRTSFEDYKSQFSKNYLESEEEQRYTIYKSNLDFVNSWDAESRGFQVGINKFSDLTLKEFVAFYNGLNITVDDAVHAYDVVIDADPVGAVDVDWRTKGAVTGVKDQAQCGSCWSFSSTGSIEGAYFLKTGKLVSLSEQDLMDCSVSLGNQGCNGGDMDAAFQYVINNKGIDTEASYPYKATGPNKCQFKPADIGATITGFHDVKSGSETDLLDAVNKQPVSVAIDASHQSFQMYHSGVYYEPTCSSTRLDHGVLVVGYGTDDTGVAYWIVKNSWGSSWGSSGYLNMSRNKNNNCGIASAASYPIA